MGARKGAARVGACLVPLENNLFWDFFSLLWGGVGFFHIEFFFSFFGCHLLYARGGRAFSHYVQNFFGAHALVVRVIANMVH